MTVLQGGLDTGRCCADAPEFAQRGELGLLRGDRTLLAPSTFFHETGVKGKQQVGSYIALRRTRTSNPKPILPALKEVTTIARTTAQNALPALATGQRRN